MFGTVPNSKCCESRSAHEADASFLSSGQRRGVGGAKSVYLETGKFRLAPLKLVHATIELLPGSFLKSALFI